MSTLRQEQFNQPHEYDQYLTQVDLEIHPEWETAFKTGDRSVFERVLHELGADLRYGYSEEIAHVRARRNDLPPSKQVQYGMLVRFKERTDKWWVSNMMEVSDIVRNTKNSLRATGMRESLMEDSPMNAAMMEAAERMLVPVDIKVNMGEDKDLADLIKESK